MALALVPHAVASGLPLSVVPALLPVTLLMKGAEVVLTPVTTPKMFDVVTLVTADADVLEMLVTQVTAFAAPAARTACRATTLALVRSS